ncbi:YhfH family protein [Bhargavaea cecembensis]|nr:YhfH family protein [Bhargavaea cecembensis]
MTNINRKPKMKKICVECGCEIIEKVESPHHECERCIGKQEL